MIKKAALALALFCASLHAQMIQTGHHRTALAKPFSIVQAVHCGNSGTPVNTCNMPQNVTAGNILVFWSFDQAFSPNVDWPQDTGCAFNSWVHLQSYQSANFMGIGEAYCAVVTSGPDTVSIVGGTLCTYIVVEIHGQNASPIDSAPAIVPQSPTFTTTVTASVTTTVPGDLVLGFEAYEYGTTTITASSGWTFVVGDGTGSNYRPINLFSESAPTAGTYSVTFTNNNAANSRNMTATIIAIKSH